MSAVADRRKGLGPWQGRAFLSLGRAVYLGPAGDTSPHAHHAIQIGIALQTPLRLRHAEGNWQPWDGVIVSPDVVHQLDGGWGDLLLAYVEPESTSGRRILEIGDEPVRAVSASTISAVRTAARRITGHPPNQQTLGAIFEELMQSVGLALDSAKTTDLRVEHAVRELRTTLGSQASMSELARAVGLSPSRLRHLFRSEVGMSAQSYIVWLRINEACAALARGASLSDAAYQVGFSDAAHFTRTFRRTFGLAPSQLADRLTWV